MAKKTKKNKGNKLTIRMPKRLPCPCCGNKKLYIGHTSATSYGVRCEHFPPYLNGCGLMMSVDLASSRVTDSKGILIKPIPFDQVGRHILKMAIDLWNTRC